MSLTFERRLGEAQRAILLAIILLLVLFPTYWMVITSVKTNREMYKASSILWVQSPTLSNFVELFTKTHFLAQLWNSIVVSVSSTVVAVAISALGAYSLTRLRFPGRGAAGGAIFFAYLLPPALLFIPLYLLFNRIGLLDTLIALVLSYLTITVPFCTWVLRGYFMSIPRELDEAALVDGCTRLQSLRHVVIPLAAPGVATAAIFAFTLAWNEYLYAFVFTSRAETTTATVGLTMLIMGDVFLWGQIMAGAVVMSLPILFLYIVAQRYVITGMTAGAVKS